MIARSVVEDVIGASWALLLLLQVAEDAWHQCDQDCPDCSDALDPDVLEDATAALFLLVDTGRH